MKVAAYRNLHTGTLSLQSREGESYGRVIDHPDSVCLINCDFVVRKAGLKKCREEGKKNVHAFVVGDLAVAAPSRDGQRVRYNPYEMDCFQFEGNPVRSATEVSIFADGGIYLNGVSS